MSAPNGLDHDAKNQKIPNTQVLGEVAWLYANSSLHGEWQVQSMMQWVLPAIMTQQFRLYHEEGRAIGYVSWAYLSEEAEATYMANPRNLQPKDWQSGDRWWIMDFIIPFGHVWPVVHDLRSNIFKGQKGRAIRVKQNAETARIFKILGKRQK